MTLNLSVIAPNRTLWNSEVEELVLSCENGQVGILPNHAPLVMALKGGVLKMRIKSQWTAMSLLGGFAQIDSNRIIVLVADEADTASELGP